MNILFLSPRQCRPARSGAKLREFHFLRALAQRNEVTHLYFADAGAEALTRKDFPFCKQVKSFPKPGAYSPWKIASGVFSSLPISVLNYASPAMEATVRRLTAETRFDLIHLDSIHMIQYGLAAGPGARLVYNWHNIESEALRRYSASSHSLARRWYASLTAGKMESLERDILRNGFGHVVCSDRERDQLRNIVSEADIETIQNGVDTEYFQGAGASVGPNSAAGARIVFVGSFDYYPNVEAATSFAQKHWPLVQQRIPGATLFLVGANPTAAVQALANLPGVTVTGTVPDVRPYYGGALAAIVPLRTGGGTRLKILEAMAAGVPVVSTPLGAEGLAVTPGEDILMADPDDSAAWVDHLLLLLESPQRRRQLAASGQRLVKSRYDWETLGQELCDTYERWLAERTR